MAASGTFTAAQVLTAAQMNLLSNAVDGYTTVATAAGTSTQTVNSNYQTFYTGSTTQSHVMPVTTTLTLGWKQRVVNNSTGIVTVKTSDSTTIYAVPSGGDVIFTCILASGTTAASWDYKNYKASGSTFVGAQATANAQTFSYTTTVNTLVTFNTENFDTDAFHDTGSNTGRMTIPSGKDGKYLFSAAGIFMGTVPSYCYIKLYKNGAAVASSVAYGGQIGHVLANSNAAVTGSVVCSAVAGDYFELYIQSDQGTGSKTLDGSFTCTYLGA